MDAQHTPGPWSVLKSDTVPDNHWCVAACGGSADGSGTKVLVVAPIQDYCMDVEDDASLIAAAPKLLDIAQRLGVYLPAELQPEVNAVIAEALGHDG